YLFIIKEPLKISFYDVVNNGFSYTTLVFPLVLFYLIIIYNLEDKNNFNKYLYLKFKNKIDFYNTQVLTILISALLLILFIDIISIIECLGHITFKNIYSEYFSYTMLGKLNVVFEKSILNAVISKITPLEYTLYINLFVFLNLSFLGLLFLLINIFFKKRELSLLVVLSINYLSWALDSVNFIEKFTFTKNVYFVQSTIDTLDNYKFLANRVLYWFILIILTYFIGRYFILKKDFSFKSVGER
ncbi:MAG: hypothetical protein ACRC7R_01840, partial [Sarcina sp.]